MLRLLTLSSAAALAAAFVMPAPAMALSMQECSAKYQAAKEADTLKGMKWNDFRKAECAADDAATAPEPQPSAKPAAKPAATAAAPSSGGGLSMKECGAKYQSAKEAGTLKGLTWNEYRKAECAAEDAAAAPEPQPSAKPAAKPSATAAAPSSGGGLTMKECSVKYQAAKQDGSLKGMKWNDFRKAECSDDDASEADAAAAEQEADKSAPKSPASTKTTAEKPATTTDASASRPTTVGKGGFPSDVSSKYASETPGKARMHTCLDQYRANKTAGVDQPNWIMKGGGYYSQCNARLKEGA